MHALVEPFVLVLMRIFLRGHIRLFGKGCVRRSFLIPYFFPAAGGVRPPPPHHPPPTPPPPPRHLICNTIYLQSRRVTSPHAPESTHALNGIESFPVCFKGQSWCVDDDKAGACWALYICDERALAAAKVQINAAFPTRMSASVDENV